MKTLICLPFIGVVIISTYISIQEGKWWICPAVVGFGFFVSFIKSLLMER